MSGAKIYFPLFVEGLGMLTPEELSKLAEPWIAKPYQMQMISTPRPKVQIAPIKFTRRDLLVIDEWCDKDGNFHPLYP